MAERQGKFLHDENRRYSTAPDPTGMKYMQNRKQRRAASAGLRHRQHQQGDEIACSCGRRWPVGENHP